MKLTSHPRLIAIFLMVVAGLLSPAQNRLGKKDLNVPKGWFSIPPEKVTWNGIADGRAIATLFGDAAKPELYGILVKFPPNSIVKAHCHPNDRYVVVLSGAFFHGHGNAFDRSRLELRSTGTTFSEPAGVAHFAATEAEGAVIYIVGIGPNRTDDIEK